MRIRMELSWREPRNNKMRTVIHLARRMMRKRDAIFHIRKLARPSPSKRHVTVYVNQKSLHLSLMSVRRNCRLAQDAQSRAPAMTCRCPYCSGAAVLPPVPSSSSEEKQILWPGPVILPGPLRTASQADRYDRVFEISLNHYNFVSQNSNPKLSLGAAVAFADAFVETVGNSLMSGSLTQTKEKIEVIPDLPEALKRKNDPKVAVDKSEDLYKGPVSDWTDKDDDNCTLDEWAMIVDETGSQPRAPQLPHFPVPQGPPRTFQPQVGPQHRAKARAASARSPLSSRPTPPAAKTTCLQTKVDMLAGDDENRWMYLVSVMRWRRRWSLKATAKKYANRGMPKNLDGPPQGFGWHIGRWQWREIRQYW